MDAANWAALLAAIPPVDPHREGFTPLSWYHGALRSSCGAAVADPSGNRRNPASQQEDADLVTLPADSLQKKKKETQHPCGENVEFATSPLAPDN